MPAKDSSYSLQDLLYLMSRLRNPKTGCPWDIKQNYLSITPSTLEESYEVVDAIEKEDFGHLREELGDLLFQVVFYTQLATEDQRFSFADVVHELTAKLLRRHPHVFPDGTLTSERGEEVVPDTQGIKMSWEQTKDAERKQKGNDGLLDDVPLALPALSRAAKLQKRAAKVGFDWHEVKGALLKIREELSELEMELEAADNSPAVQNELGDLLFSCVNLTRFLGYDSEQTLRFANTKFERRFKFIEERIRDTGKSLEDVDVNQEAMELLWRQAKQKGL